MSGSSYRGDHLRLSAMHAMLVAALSHIPSAAIRTPEDDAAGPRLERNTVRAWGKATNSPNNQGRRGKYKARVHSRGRRQQLGRRP